MIKLSHTVAVTALVTMGMFGGAAFADSDSDAARVIVNERQAQVTVVGEASLSSAPDVMRLNVGVEVRRPTAGQAFADARQAAARLTKALLDTGIDAKDLRTNELSLGPEYDNYPKVAGYRAAQGVEAVVRDVESADRVIEAAVAAGEEVRLNGISFEISDGRRLLRAAREAAFKDARARAEQYARLSGRELGQVVRITEENVTPPRPMAYGAGLAADKASISPGQQAVSVNVQVVYALR
ncbi:SIMPL domain-containing protein [Streptosporangium sp. NPDC051022]|uniref:SIMPL domain-containing protein n=1 Tax=Streptosporangium sp. NPDC051022 TaxID=3155752 RepID=UPI00343B0053